MLREYQLNIDRFTKDMTTFVNRKGKISDEMGYALESEML